MKNYFYFFVLSCYFGSIQADVDTNQASFAGEWLNEDVWVKNESTIRGITQIFFNTQDNQPTVATFAKCYPVDCDWGLANIVNVSEGVTHAIYSTDLKDTSIKFEVISVGKIHAHVTTSYYSSPDYNREEDYIFIRVAGVN